MPLRGTLGACRDRAIEEPGDPELWRVPVDLSAERVLAHAHTAILSEPDTGEIVAWVCFAPATLRIPTRRLVSLSCSHTSSGRLP